MPSASHFERYKRRSAVFLAPWPVSVGVGPSYAAACKFVFRPGLIRLLQDRKFAKVEVQDGFWESS